MNKTVSNDAYASALKAIKLTKTNLHLIRVQNLHMNKMQLASAISEMQFYVMRRAFVSFEIGTDEMGSDANPFEIGFLSAMQRKFISFEIGVLQSI